MKKRKKRFMIWRTNHFRWLWIVINCNFFLATYISIPLIEGAFLRSSRVLIKCCIKQFPHIRQPAPKILGFVHNLIRIADCTSDEEIAMEIWSLIIERLLHLDVRRGLINKKDMIIHFRLQ